MAKVSSEKAGSCSFCATGVLPGEPHAELKLSLWPGATAPETAVPKHQGLLMVCHRCCGELGISGTEPPRRTLMRLVNEMIIREEFMPASVPDPEPFRLESYEPETGFTDDGVEISRKPDGNSGDKHRKTVH